MARRLSARRAWVAGAAVALALLAGLGYSRWRGADAAAGSTPQERSASRDAVESGTAAAAGEPHAGIPRVDDLDALDPLVRDAIVLGVSAVERRPGDARAWGELGIVYQAHRYFALAERCLTEARRLDGRAPEWPYLLGVLAEERGDVERAASLYGEALDRSPGAAAARYRLGNVLLVAGRLDDAERAFAALAASAPAEPWGPLGLGRVAQRRGSAETAAGHFERALAADAANAQTAYLLAAAYRELGRGDEARRLVERASEGVKPLGPADPVLDRVRIAVRGLETLIQAANQALAAGDAASAEALYAQVLDSDPAHYDALFNLGLLYGRQERFAESQAMLERAVAARPESSQARLLLALSLASQDRLVAARGELRALLEHDPDHREARALLGDMER